MSAAQIGGRVASLVLVCVVTFITVIALGHSPTLAPEASLREAISASNATKLTSGIMGAARVVDGDTLDIGGRVIRLWGIDAPESAQRCEGRDGRTYECGRDATAVLSELTRSRQVACEARDRDRYQRTVAICRTEAGELNAAMVRRGWAIDYTQYSGGRYKTEEAAAKAEKLGIWSGRFDLPSEWRRNRR